VIQIRRVEHTPAAVDQLIAQIAVPEPDPAEVPGGDRDPPRAARGTPAGRRLCRPAGQPGPGRPPPRPRPQEGRRRLCPHRLPARPGPAHRLAPAGPPWRGGHRTARHRPRRRTAARDQRRLLNRRLRHDLLSTARLGEPSARAATTPRRRCSGTRSRRSCGGGPPSPSTVPWAGWSACRRASCAGWSGSPMPRWPSSNGAGRSTSTPSSAWTRPPPAAGASTRELMVRMGHSSSAAALRYQHVMAGRDAAIAAALDELVAAAWAQTEDAAAARSGTRMARPGNAARRAGVDDRPACS
jgi:hypothetical protein